MLQQVCFKENYCTVLNMFQQRVNRSPLTSDTLKTTVKMSNNAKGRNLRQETKNSSKKKKLHFGLLNLLGLKGTHTQLCKINCWNKRFGRLIQRTWEKNSVGLRRMQPWYKNVYKNTRMTYIKYKPVSVEFTVFHHFSTKRKTRGLQRGSETMQWSITGFISFLLRSIYVWFLPHLYLPYSIDRLSSPVCISLGYVMFVPTSHITFYF